MGPDDLLYQVPGARCRVIYEGTRDVEPGTMVDLGGLEPPTSSVRLMRAPNCATGPYKGKRILLEGGGGVKFDAIIAARAPVAQRTVQEPPKFEIWVRVPAGAYGCSAR